MISPKLVILVRDRKLIKHPKIQLARIRKSKGINFSKNL